VPTISYRLHYGQSQTPVLEIFPDPTGLYRIAWPDAGPRCDGVADGYRDRKVAPTAQPVLSNPPVRTRLGPQSDRFDRIASRETRFRCFRGAGSFDDPINRGLLVRQWKSRRRRRRPRANRLLECPINGACRCWRFRIFNFDPGFRPTRAVNRCEALGHDTFQS